VRSVWSYHKVALLASVTVGAIALGLASAASTEEQCRVQLGQGWSALTGRGTITMKNVGKPCGSAMYSVPDTNVPVDTITVDIAPQKGSVKVEVPRFFYTPQVGFTGRDRFTIVAEGPDRSRQMRVKLKGEITVQVEP
jgi:hypothetical protein